MTILGADDEGRLRALLDSLGYDLEPSILIGGWATNARVGGEISHEITHDRHVSSVTQSTVKSNHACLFFPSAQFGGLS